ncbi:hypothetical protein QUB56_18655 [Microcoleus sp. AR_TQ3_B6]|uniref:hypothetical protein n=1 Tax=Microcoleus sp. AR_TQ3_B6 TaxID=3055284 RepID=UPI002FD06F1D
MLTDLILSCCASNLTVNFSTIIVRRAREPVSVLNLDGPQPIGAIVTELLDYSQEALWAIALLPTAFGQSTAVFC